jgi:small neutral amino acid transporter SnatA (MarC family)
VTALSATAILLLIMDPFGNMVTINTLLAELPPAKRRRIILREALIAYGVLLLALFVVKLWRRISDDGAKILPAHSLYNIY